MNYGINIISLLPVRAEADHRSEMVSQLLFGEQFTVIDKKKDWLQISCALDNYEGWITRGQSVPLQYPPALGLVNPEEVISQPLRVSLFDYPDDSSLLLPGSTLPGLNPSKGEFIISGNRYKVHGSINRAINEPLSAWIAHSALLFINAPYLWGGRSLFGIDCSGLSQLVYKICGIALPRDAAEQVRTGQEVSFNTEAKAGDLAFFAGPDEEISHVGIVLEEGKLIHASGKVRIDNFDHQGIYQKERQAYTHSLRVIKHYLPAR